MVKIIIQTSTGNTTNMVASSAASTGIRITGINPTLGFVYADADSNQVQQISSKPGVIKVFYDEPVRLVNM